VNGSDGSLLNIHDDEFDPHLLKFGCESGVVGMIVGCQQVFNISKLDADPFEFMLQFGERSGETHVDEQARFGIGKDVVVGGCVADVENVHDGNQTPP